MKRIWLLTATLFNIGRMPIAPGTCGSLVTAVIVYLVRPYWQAPVYIQAVVILGVFMIGIPAASHAEKHFGKKDPGQCVIDEVAGQMVSLLMVPHSIKFYVAAFLLFRFFDILKPYPIRKLEQIPDGLGIMIDDIGAGIYALGCFHLGVYLYSRFLVG